MLIKMTSSICTDGARHFNKVFIIYPSYPPHPPKPAFLHSEQAGHIPVDYQSPERSDTAEN